MSVYKFSPESLARLAFLTTASIEDLHEVHAHNVIAFVLQYPREAANTHAVSLEELRALVDSFSPYATTQEQYDEAKRDARLLGCNLEEHPADEVLEAVTRIQAAAYCAFVDCDLEEVRHWCAMRYQERRARMA